MTETSAMLVVDPYSRSTSATRVLEPVKPAARTNEERRREKIERRRSRAPSRTPLMDLGMWMFQSGQDSIRGAPWSLLEAAQLHVEVRLIAIAAERVRSHRTRSTEKWLGHWMKIIQCEIKRRFLKVVP